jgi:periplasmic copper chaperone A
VISKRRALLVFAGIGLICFAHAAAPKSTIHISKPRARASAPGAGMGAIYLQIKNSGKTADALISAQTDAAKSIMIHATDTGSDGVSRMLHLPDGLALPAGKRTELQPGGTHLMLMGLRQPLKVGARFTLRLQFRDAQTQVVNVTVVTDP